MAMENTSPSDKKACGDGDHAAPDAEDRSLHQAEFPVAAAAPRPATKEVTMISKNVASDDDWESAAFDMISTKRRGVPPLVHIPHMRISGNQNDDDVVAAASIFSDEDGATPMSPSPDILATKSEAEDEDTDEKSATTKTMHSAYKAAVSLRRSHSESTTLCRTMEAGPYYSVVPSSAPTLISSTPLVLEVVKETTRGEEGAICVICELVKFSRDFAPSQWKQYNGKCIQCLPQSNPKFSTGYENSILAGSMSVADATMPSTVIIAAPSSISNWLPPLEDGLLVLHEKPNKRPKKGTLSPMSAMGDKSMSPLSKQMFSSIRGGGAFVTVEKHAQMNLQQPIFTLASAAIMPHGEVTQRGATFASPHGLVLAPAAAMQKQQTMMMAQVPPGYSQAQVQSMQLQVEVAPPPAAAPRSASAADADACPLLVQAPVSPHGLVPVLAATMQKEQPMMMAQGVPQGYAQAQVQSFQLQAEVAPAAAAAAAVAPTPTAAPAPAPAPAHSAAAAAAAPSPLPVQAPVQAAAHPYQQPMAPVVPMDFLPVQASRQSSMFPGFMPVQQAMFNPVFPNAVAPQGCVPRGFVSTQVFPGIMGTGMTPGMMAPGMAAAVHRGVALTGVAATPILIQKQQLQGAAIQPPAMAQQHQHQAAANVVHIALTTPGTNNAVTPSTAESALSPLPSLKKIANAAMIVHQPNQQHTPTLSPVEIPDPTTHYGAI